jgi:hypothetical protein
MDSDGTTSAAPRNTDKADPGRLFRPIKRLKMFVAFFTSAQKALKSATGQSDKELNAPGKPGSWSG